MFNHICFKMKTKITGLSNDKIKSYSNAGTFVMIAWRIYLNANQIKRKILISINFVRMRTVLKVTCKVQFIAIL
jgi:hypothetical protein